MQKVFSDIEENKTGEIVEFILTITPPPTVITFTGEVGAGKTSLIKKLVLAMGSDDDVSSPTFSLVNEYHTASNKIIYHSDWYRINKLEELYDAGIEEYLHDDNSILLIEWPEIGKELLDGINHVSIEVFHLDSGRKYIISDIS